MEACVGEVGVVRKDREAEAPLSRQLHGEQAFWRCARR